MQDELNQFFSEKKHLYHPYSKLQEIKLVNIGLASSEQIKKWAEKKLPNGKILGQVTNANTLHHKTFKPLKGGLFCERIFGPVKDFQCSCGKTKKFTSSILAQFKEEKREKTDFLSNHEEQERERLFCPVCDVEYTWSVIRRYQFGYIQLVAPVTHLWYLKGSPSYLSLLLDMKKKKLESVVYCSENMTLETLNSIIFSFFSNEKIKGLSSRVSVAPKQTSSLYNSWEKVVKNLESKKSLNRNHSENSLIKKELVFSKITSYLFFLKAKAKKASVQKSLNSKIKTRGENVKPKRLSGWRNLNIQTLNSFFSKEEKKEEKRETYQKTSMFILRKILLKLKNLKKIEEDLKSNKNLYKIAHKKSHQIILKIQIEFLKKNIKEILNSNFSNVDLTLKQSLKKNNEKLVLNSYFFSLEKKTENNKRKKKGILNNFEKTKEQPQTINNNLVFNNFDKTNELENKEQFFLNQNDKKENQNGRFFYLNRKNGTIVKRRSQSSIFSFVSREKKIQIIKSILLFRIKKEIFNSEITKIFFSDSFFLSHIRNMQVPVNFFNLKKNERLSSYKKLNLEEKKRMLFTFAFLIFNFPKKKKTEEKILKIIRINTLNRIIKNLRLEEKKDYLENSKIKNFLFNLDNILFLKNKKKDLKKKNKEKRDLKRFLGLRHDIEENKKTKERKDGESYNHFVVKRLKKFSESEKSKKLSSQNYSLYCISNRFCWENEKNWSNFVYFFSAPTKIDDKPILTYIERIPSTFSRPFAGANVLQKLLTEFQFQEFKKMDRQNRILLYELNKQIQKDFPESQFYSSTQGFLKEKKEDEFERIEKGLSKSLGSFVSKEKPFLKKKSIRKEEERKNRKEKSLNFLFQFSSLEEKRTNKRQKKKLAQKRDQLIRRTKFIRKLFRKNSQPESMILSFLPVLPPDLRPILKMQDQIAASDLNRLYQRVLYRNERLKKFLNDSAMSYSYEMKYAQRLLQEAVDNLLQNGKAGGTPERDSRNRLLKSLSEILKGKQGRFRQHLLGKRVDYSGRSVIVVGPKLKIHECGLPKEMALELFLPFLLKRLIHLKIARTVIGAKTILKNDPTFTWEILYEVMQNHPVLLNRAPTLHRLGIQAFQPKLVEGRAILLHPLVCPAFNADFDGDQMAVHIPLTVEARSEAWKLMCSGNHFFSPATGDPLLLPSQDMVLGCYYLTTENKVKHSSLFQSKQALVSSYFVSKEKLFLKKKSIRKEKKEKREKITESLFSLENKNVHNIIWVKWDGSLESVDNPEDPLELRVNSFGNWNEIFSKSQYYFDFNGLLISQFIRTTNGRLFFNKMLSFFYK
uniref:DNA-directed RNA polymerase subunit beta' n=1 Tax=Jenufa perforata TaxID=993091 RepID=A0A0S2LN75_9CHLO|nr:beta' subunit of RNA polymerase [Jenufa perforata]ALO62892.1 beta' subunit of RNA polymerase [Jenufa perforata]